MTRTMDEMREKEREDSKVWLKNPATWPNWPLQTVKKRILGKFPDCAVVYDFGTPGESFKPKLINQNAFLLTPEELEKHKDDPDLDIDKFVDVDGWVVD